MAFHVTSYNKVSLVADSSPLMPAVFATCPFGIKPLEDRTCNKVESSGSDTKGRKRYVVQCNAVSSRAVVQCHVMSNHLKSCCVISCRVVYIVPYGIVYIVLCNIVLCRFVYIVLCRDMLFVWNTCKNTTSKGQS